MRQWLLGLYQRLFVRRALYPFHELLFKVAVRGLGVGIYGTSWSTGELEFLRLLAPREGVVAVDVGANIGEYTELLMEICPGARVLALEPSRKAYDELLERTGNLGVEAWNLALGHEPGTATLYDYAEVEGSQHASLYQGVFDFIHNSRATGVEVEVQTLDAFLEGEGIDEVTLLKIDTEGSELAVLEGGARTLGERRVEVVHFEFNEMNVVSRCFLRDFTDLLEGYRFFRMLPDGLVELGAYRPLTHEIFFYQNIAAIREGSEILDRL